MCSAPSTKVETIRSRLKMPSNSFSTYRKRLTKKGIVRSPEYGWLSFTLPRFKEFILRQEEIQQNHLRAQPHFMKQCYWLRFVFYYVSVTGDSANLYGMVGQRAHRPTYTVYSAGSKPAFFFASCRYPSPLGLMASNTNTSRSSGTTDSQQSNSWSNFAKKLVKTN